MSGKPNAKKEDLDSLLTDLKTYIRDNKPPDPPDKFSDRFDTLCNVVSQLSEAMIRQEEQLQSILTSF